MARVKKIDTSKLAKKEDCKRLPGIPAEILIPAGKCPVKLNEVNKSSIKKWIDQVDSHIDPWDTMTESAYCYWLRESLNIFSGEYAQACLIVKEICEKRDAKRVKQVEKLLKQRQKAEEAEE
jgi:hypothetical protein